MKLYKDNNNNIFAYEEDGSQDHLIGDKVQITEEEASSIYNQKTQDELDKLTYAEKRAMAYKPLTEQLDMQYWDTVNGTDTWKQHIDAVKAAYPKPTE
jgi:photosystem II stability/assembly factor-like uncharacterized protein